MRKLLLGCHSDSPETTAASGCSQISRWDGRYYQLTTVINGAVTWARAHGVTSATVTPQRAHPHQRAAPCQAEENRVTTDAEVHFAHDFLSQAAVTVLLFIPALHHRPNEGFASAVTTDS